MDKEYDQNDFELFAFDGYKKILRLKVPTGWIVLIEVWRHPNYNTNMIFVPDKKHDWNIDNLKKTYKTDMKIEDMGFSSRIINSLKAESIYLLKDLLCKSEEDLLRTPNLGYKSVGEIKNKLLEYGLKLISPSYY